MRKLAIGCLALSAALLGCDRNEAAELEEELAEEAASVGQTAEEAYRETTEAMTPPAGDARLSFAAWDVNGDGEIGEAEFQSWWVDANPFYRWDADADAELSREEFSLAFQTATFADFDADGDGTLTEKEVQRALFERWDADDDGVLVESEWHASKLIEGRQTQKPSEPEKEPKEGQDRSSSAESG